LSADKEKKVISQPNTLTKTFIEKVYSKGKTPQNFFDYEQTTITGERIYMNKFADKKVILVVNVASKSMNTQENYIWMAEMKRQFPELEVVTFPCD
jgi:hypothetical protein